MRRETEIHVARVATARLPAWWCARLRREARDCFVLRRDLVGNRDRVVVWLGDVRAPQGVVFTLRDTLTRLCVHKIVEKLLGGLLILSAFVGLEPVAEDARLARHARED